MKIVYMPQRSSLLESLNSSRVFYDVKDMFEFISLNSQDAFSSDDISISYYSYDLRINQYKFAICVDRFYWEDYLEKYHHPQIIGFCVFNANKSDMLKVAKCYFD